MIAAARVTRSARRWHLAGVALPLLALGFLLGCGERKQAAPRPADAPAAPRRVILITVDTLRADHLSAYGYPRLTSPHLDQWGGEGRLFERAIVQWPKTGSSFASMFTGRYPQTTGLHHSAAVRIPDEMTTLPELLRQQGYKTAAVVSNPVLTSRLGWSSGFDEYLESWGKSTVGSDPSENRHLFAADRVNSLALPLFERHAKDDKLFVWLHYTDPHAPYVLPKGEKNPFLGDAHYTGSGSAQVDPNEARGKLFDGQKDLRFYVAQYDANILYADRKIAEALEKARALGLLEDSLVIFTSDHGESLGEHDLYFEHGPLAYNTTLHVPLFFTFSAQAGKKMAPARISNPVELVDLYPTLRDLVAPNAEVEGLEGKSLLPFLGFGAPPAKAGQPFRVAFAGAGKRKPYTHYRTVQDERWKLIYLPSRNRRDGKVIPERFQLFDLAADPLESRNLATTDTEQVRRLRRDLLAWIKEDRWNGQDEEAMAKNDREVEHALKALGYLQ